MTDAKIPRIGVTDQVIGQIRTALEAGALLPGTMLGVAELARQFGVSAGAVQKALGSLESESLVDSTGARTYVITPTPAWYLAILAHSSGLSIAAAQTAVPLMPDAARAGFDRAAAAACEAWSSRTVPQTDAAVGTWGLLDLLAGETQNPHLAREHHRLKTALAFGTRHLGVERNPQMLVTALTELAAVVHEGDADEAAEIVRDLYSFVALPYQLQMR
ncbi:GntR family transcriptional regulator [Microbacterium sp. CJ88]|uniref:GntR family transcriptional regulator n=1 Tax=Microbacterium sp. CJ88 TaxID=3445672 RepID=UPI003F65BF6A